MSLNLLFEGHPLGAVFSVVEKRFGAIFKPKIFTVRVANPLPLTVPDDATYGDIMAFHKFGDQFGGASLGRGEGTIAVLTHFDADGVSVSCSLIVSMLALFISRQALIDGIRVYAEVPSEIAERIVFRLQSASTQNFGMGACSGARTIALSGVNRNVSR